MAIIRTSGIIGAISGSIGSLTFARGPQGPIVRTRPLKTRSLTRKQSICRAQYASAHGAWQALDEAERQGWRNVAPNYHRTNRLGVQSQLSGWQLFLKIYVQHSHSWLTPPDSPPIIQTQPGPLTVLLDLDHAGGNECTVTRPPIVAVILWELQISRTWSSKAIGPGKQWTFVIQELNFAIAIDIDAELAAATPPLVQSEVIWYRVRNVKANRIPSPWLIDSVVVA